MNPRISLLVCLGLLLFALVPRGASGQLAPAPEIGLGFSPSSVLPVSHGVPIFTQGDDIWLESYYNATIEAFLENPQGGAATGVLAVEPGQLFLLYSLNETDYSGSYTLSVATPSGTADVPILVVPTNSSLDPILSGARLAGNELNQTFSLPPTDAYDIQVCAVGQSIVHSFGFGLAGGSNGTVEVSLIGNSSLVSASDVSSPLSMWLELYSEYSYQTVGGDISSEDLLVASTPTFNVLPPGETQQVPLLQQMPMREGRFDLRIFDRTSSGLGLHDAQLLRVANGTWVQLGGCTAAANAYSSQLSLVTNLDSDNSTWPRQLITMYTMTGVESYTEIAIPGSEAAVHFRDFPEDEPLNGVGIVPAASGLLPTDWSVANSSLYLLTSGISRVSITLSFSGVALYTLNVSIPGRYTSKSFVVAAGTLVVSATQQGIVLKNSTISVAAQGSRPVVVKQVQPGSASLLLLPGNYTVAATYGGVTSITEVSVAAGSTSTVALDLTQQALPAVLYLLGAVGVAAVLANIYLWRQYLARRKVYG